jgi:hypothetical protein
LNTVLRAVAKVVSKRRCGNRGLTDRMSDLINPHDYIARSVQAWHTGPLVLIDETRESNSARCRIRRPATLRAGSTRIRMRGSCVALWLCLGGRTPSGSSLASLSPAAPRELGSRSGGPSGTRKTRLRATSGRQRKAENISTAARPCDRQSLIRSRSKIRQSEALAPCTSTLNLREWLKGRALQWCTIH